MMMMMMITMMITMIIIDDDDDDNDDDFCDLKYVGLQNNYAIELIKWVVFEAV